jgi:hypothetical protein
MLTPSIRLAAHLQERRERNSRASLAITPAEVWAHLESFANFAAALQEICQALA